MDKVKKTHIKKYIGWIALAALVALLTAMPLLARQDAEAEGPVASVLSAEVTEGTVTSAIRGGGNILAENVEEVTLPNGVKVTEFLVKNGQYVTEGTPLASVDKVSVMTAIMEVNKTLDYLQEELESARDETVSSTVTATAGGRVKKLFAQKGDSVQDVMLRNGCLAILSLDGRMAVKLEKDISLGTGEAVTVTLADGTEVSGRVDSNLDGTVIITVEDEGYAVGQSVTVCAEGQTLGQGELYIHNAWKVTAFTGTIDTVSTKEEKELSAGAAIFTLTDRDFEAELQRRSGQHREYEELLQKLFRMYESGVITAPCDGEVEGVDKDSPYLLSSASESRVLAPLNSETPETGYRILLLSYNPDDGNVIGSGSSTPVLGCSNDENCRWEETDLTKHGANCIKHCDGTDNCSANTHYGSCLSRCDMTTGCDAQNHKPGCASLCTIASAPGKCANSAFTDPSHHHPDCIHSCTYGTTEEECRGTKYHALGCIESCDSAAAETGCDATGDHKSDCICACIEADLTGKCPATKHHSADCIEMCSGKLGCPGNKHIAACPHYNLTYTAVVGVVVRMVEGVIEYTYESATPVAVTKTGSAYTIAGTPNTKTMVNGPAFVASGGVKVSAGDVILVITGTNADGAAIVKDQVYVYRKSTAGNTEDPSRSETESESSDSMSISSMTGGFSGFGSYGGTAVVEEEPLFDLEGQTLLTVTPKNTATVTISVDEHDIARLSTGMAATVKVEALRDEAFAATVTGIAVSGSNNGGSSKFAVELTLDMSADMLSGMSASAVIPLEEKHNVLLIPAAALVQQGAKTLVYTGLNDEGEPSDPVEVTTGVSDGENVEILAGLSKGQKIYYSYYDTVALDTSAEAQKYTFG